MKIPVPLSIVLAAAIAVLVAFALLHSFAARSEQHVRDLQAALNVQTDVVAPFLLRFHLGSGASAEANTFAGFPEDQVKAGKITEADAKSVWAALSAAGQGEPVRSARGWIMPAIAKGN